MEITGSSCRESSRRELDDDIGETFCTIRARKYLHSSSIEEDYGIEWGLIVFSLSFCSFLLRLYSLP